MTNKTNLSELKVGNVYSELSHYKLLEVKQESIIVEHFESGSHIELHIDYLKDFGISADLVIDTKKVTKEDKRDGTLGIRSIFENIPGGEVFTVCYQKQDTAKTKKQYNQELESLAKEFSLAIDKAKRQKTGVAEVAKSYLKDIIKNPILKVIEGEDRILRGYKVKSYSRDGRYTCVDMDIPKSEESSNRRPVNILSIKWLIYRGVKYIVQS